MNIEPISLEFIVLSLLLTTLSVRIFFLSYHAQHATDTFNISTLYLQLFTYIKNRNCYMISEIHYLEPTQQIIAFIFLHACREAMKRV